jgi:hypothetical protein
MTFDSTVRASGHYGFSPVGSLIEPKPENHWHDVCGMPMNMEYFYGSVRSTDGEYYWWPIRGFYRESARFLHLSESHPGGDFTFATDQSNSYGGPVVHGERNGRWGVHKPDGTPLMEVWDDRMEWHDGDGLLTITGELVGPALQFMIPDANESMAYTSRLFRATGTIKGREVTGLVFHDSMHTPSDVEFMKSSYITKLETAWVAFATEFADGEIHAGHLIHGAAGFNLMIVHRTDGLPLIARDIEVSAELDGEPTDDASFPTRVTYRGGGQTWVWEAGEGGRCPVRHELPAGHRWRQGWVHLDGETRAPKSTEALMETYNGRLVDTGALRVRAAK